MADEYIKREDAKKQMARFIGYIGIDDDMVERFKIALDKISAVDVAPTVHGEWGKGNMPTYGGYKCSVCGENTLHYKANFCPNCGARMDGE